MIRCFITRSTGAYSLTYLQLDGFTNQLHPYFFGPSCGDDFVSVSIVEDLQLDPTATGLIFSWEKSWKIAWKLGNFQSWMIGRSNFSSC